jgi:hypothetical protein
MFCCCATCTRVSIPASHVTGAAVRAAESSGPAAAGRSDAGRRRGGGASCPEAGMRQLWGSLSGAQDAGHADEPTLCGPNRQRSLGGGGVRLYPALPKYASSQQPAVHSSCKHVCRPMPGARARIDLASAAVSHGLEPRVSEHVSTEGIQAEPGGRRGVGEDGELR